MATRLEAELALDTKAFVAAAKEAEKAGVQMGNSLSAAGSKTSKALASAAASAKTSGVSFVGFSRVLQDAAFGPVAIANNLQGLSDDLKQLKQVANDTGQSLGKTLLQSLAGGGGINLALGGLTLALSLASVGMAAWSRVFGDSKKAVDNTKLSLDDYVKSLEQVTQAQLKGAQSAASELTTLKILYQRTQDVTLSQQERLKAVNQLQEKYPSYFGNIKDETILAGKAGKSYDDLSRAILASARARAATDLIVVNQQRQLTNSQKIIDLEKEREKAKADLKALASLYDKDSVEGSVAVNALKNVELDIQRQINNLKTDSNKLTERNNRLVAEANKQVDKGGNLDGFKDENTGSGKTGKSAKPNERGPHINLSNGVSSKNIAGQLKKSLDDGTKEFLAAAASTPISLTIPIETILEDELFLDALARLQEFNASANDIINNGIISGLSGIGDAFGSALASGNNALEAAGSALLGTLGGVLVQLGELAIATGVGVKAIKAALKSLNPVVAIAAGIALVALGSFIKGKAANIGGGGGGGSSSSGGGKIKRFAAGGIVHGPTLGLMGEYAGARSNPEVIAPLNKLKDLLPDNNGNTTVLNGSLRISGSDLLFMLEKERSVQQRRGRI